MTTQALILVGGFGTRLGDLTKAAPKPMMDVDGRPFLEFLIWNLKRHGITDILLSVGYLADRIMDHFGDGSRFGVSIDYVVEEEPAGTGGGVKLAEAKLGDTFFVLNGDTLFDCNYLDLAVTLKETGCLAALALREEDDASDYGSVVIDQGHITSFREKAQTGKGLISGGVYCMKKAALEQMSAPPFSIEEDFFPVLLAQGALAGKQFDGYFIDIGTPVRLEAAQTELLDWERKPALFLDRDGVINVNYGYVHSPDKFTWIEGAPQAIKAANDRGWLVIVITNQSGIGRGYYDEAQFLEFTKWINRELRTVGAHIDATYFCPHHPTEAHGEYRRVCRCRKPKPGMLENALEDWNIDKDKSFMVGDKESDVNAAEAAQIRGVFFAGDGLFELVIKEFPA